ncbi:ABC transporter permease [Paenibacillus sp. YN15]|uniref:ABC transporter permease n=1 Tax=Paenibacillus sp. YN15 TaxID=1742774 RepID=UPI000DCCCDE4|nr:ABC transporter permease [Paenibacillus sp. YN15]RAU99570.1 permease [Paenibacillus sp. YN15]
MIGGLLGAELLKLKRSMAVVLAVLGPVGVVSMEAVNFVLRYDYLVKQHEGRLWQGLLGNVSGFAPIVLLQGAALLASLVAGCEHRTHAWKQLLALPVTRFGVFLAKFLACAGLLLLSSSLLAVGTFFLGGLLGFGWHPPVRELLAASFHPTLAGLAVVSLQLWLSVMLRNQAVPLTIGIAGTIVGMFYYQLPDWVLWKWVTLPESGGLRYILFGLAASAGLLVMGAAHFGRRDVN